MPKTSSAGSTQGSTLSTAAMSATGASTAVKGSGTKMTQDAVALLKSDHRAVESLFAKFESASTSTEKTELVKQICSELVIHTLLEEEIFYPACREKADDEDPLDEAQVEHDGAKMLISDLMEASPEDDFYDAKVKVLSEYIKHHVAEEEKPRSGIFSKAKSAGVDLSALGAKLMERKTELKTQAAENGLQPPTPRAVHVQDQQTQEMGNMARYSNDRDRDDDGRFTSGGRGGSRSGGRSSGRERDEQGRFTSDDDHNGGSSYRSRSRYDDDDDDYRGRGRSGSNDRERDEQGRFMSDDDDRGGRSYRSSGRYDEDDDYRGRSSSSRSSSRYDDDDDGRGHGRGGWFGDSEGHSEAARRGRGSSGGRSSSRYEDDDDRTRGRGASSRSGSSRYDDDDDDRGRSSSGRGHGGWFGDSEGHSEASRRGWEDRSGGNNRGRGASSASRSRSSRDDDDDDRGGRGRSHGGWFGDSRGHAEAARRGWENR